MLVLGCWPPGAGLPTARLPAGRHEQLAAGVPGVVRECRRADPDRFVPKSRTFDAALEGSLADGRTTPALVAAFADPTIRAAHIYKAGAVLSVLVLMILKPF